MDVSKRFPVKIRSPNRAGRGSVTRIHYHFLLSCRAEPRYSDFMNETPILDTESEILEQVIEPDTGGMSSEAARALLRFRFNSAAVARMNDLAEKNRKGAITPSERALLERYLRVGNFLNLIHAKAHCALASPTSPAS
jgi:hypothetical protein